MALTQVPLNMLDQASGALGFRNAIINGNCRVAQRGSVSLTNNAYTYGGADRIMCYPNSFSTLSGSVAQASAGSATASGFAQAATITTTGSGSVIFATRLEAKDTARFNGKTLTISAKVYHDVGSAVGTAIQLYKANAADNFSGVTQLGTTVTTGNAATGAYTQISASFTLGSTDASNGLMVFWQFQSIGAVTSKTFAIGDLQMTEGTVVLPIDVPPIGYDTALCQRYLPMIQGLSISAHVNNSKTDGFFCVKLPVTPRVPATGITVESATSWRFNNPSNNWPISTIVFGASYGSGDYAQINFTLSTIGATEQEGNVGNGGSAYRLSFTGCEL